MKALFRKAKQKLLTPRENKISFESQLKYKIKVEPAHEFSIRLWTKIKRGMLLEFYETMTKKYSDAKERFDELQKNEFEIDKQTRSAMTKKMVGTFREIEKSVAKDFEKEKKVFKMTYVEIEKCSFKKDESDKYDVEILATGYWSQ